MAEPVVSVVIPTLGRGSLTDALASVRDQEVAVDVIVVNDSGTPLASVPGVRVIDTPGRLGPAAARNAGLAAATGDFVAFLDDDDQWLPGHLRAALTALDADPGADIYFCRGLVLQGDSARIVPVEPLGDRTIADYLYEPASWRSRSRRILTPTLVFRAAWARHTMDVTLPAGEDTWWLLTAEAAGAKVIHGRRVGALVHGDDARDRERRAARDRLDWARRIDDVVPGAAQTSFIAQRGRDAARRGDVGGVLANARAARTFGPLTRWLPLVGAELAVASLGRLRGPRRPDAASTPDPASGPPVPGTVSVVLPTLGRPTLERAVDSVRRQGVPVEILVVNDSGAPLGRDLGADVRVIDTPGRTGAAAARNAALDALTGDYFAFLDDDDVWVPGHLRRALAALDANRSTLYFCRGLVLDGTGARVVPVVPLEGRSITEFRYEFENWRTRNRRVLTTTVVARAELARIRFDESLASSEDTWWLLSAEASGARTTYRHRVGVVIEADAARESERRAVRDNVGWARRVEPLLEGAGRTALIAHDGRDAARRGDIAGVLRLARQAGEFGSTVRWWPIVAGQVALAAAVKAKRVIR